MTRLVPEYGGSHASPAEIDVQQRRALRADRPIAASASRRSSFSSTHRARLGASLDPVEIILSAAIPSRSTAWMLPSFHRRRANMPSLFPRACVASSSTALGFFTSSMFEDSSSSLRTPSKVKPNTSGRQNAAPRKPRPPWPTRPRMGTLSMERTQHAVLHCAQARRRRKARCHRGRQRRGGCCRSQTRPSSPRPWTPSKSTDVPDLGPEPTRCDSLREGRIVGRSRLYPAGIQSSSDRASGRCLDLRRRPEGITSRVPIVTLTPQPGVG